ncbi:MAG: nuclear transport factor 2 family protein [Phaeodactylibacter sp.]|nr:nuclear transport factor 2 family protein [Phaeodactylibacter sp.]
MQIILSALLSLIAAGLTPEDTAAIEQVIRTFNKGGGTNNVELLETVLSPHFRVVFNDTQAGAIKVLDRPTYIQLIENKTFGGQKRELEISFLEIHNATTATAYVHQKGSGSTLHTFLSFTKADGKWQIVQDLVTMELLDK